MVRAATAFVEFQGDFSQIQAQTRTQAKGLERSFGSTFKSIAKGAAISLGTVAVGKLLKSSFAEAEEAQKVAKQTEAVIKSTGGTANVTAKQVDSLADSLSHTAAVDDEIIKSGENVLLTFTNVRNAAGKGNDIFNQGTKAALNLSAALGTDLQGSVIQVGKALNDPIKGMTALRRVGVSFTKAQEKQVKALVASGDTLAAQKVILKELTTEFGGAAAAAATPSERLKVAVGNLEESIGRLLLPAVTKISVALAGLAEWLDRNRGAAALIGTTIAALVTVLGTMFVITKIVNVVKAFRAAMISLNLAFAANPVLLVVAAIAALGVGLFIAYKKVKPFHDAIDKLWQLLQSLFHWVQHNWPLLLGILTGPFGLAILFIVKHWSGIVDFFKNIPGLIGKALGKLASVITSPFKQAFNAIARLWNSTVGKLHFKIPGWVPGIGGKGFDVPDLPVLHSGGIFSANGGQGLALLKDGEGVFTPAQMAALGDGRAIDARTIVQGNVYGDSHLRKIFAEHDRELVAALGAGAR